MGGQGASGGTGGNGALGTAGGGGAGGSVKILSTAAFSVLGGSVNTAGGAGGTPGTDGGNGRTIIGTTVTGPNAVALANTTAVNAGSEAPMRLNPYAGFTYTPFIAPDLFGSQSMIGGANAYGLLPSNLLLTDPTLKALVDNAPSGATAFLDVVTTDLGPLGFRNEIANYRMMLFANFGSTPLIAPTLNGVALHTYGFANDGAFGGNNDWATLSSLDPGQIFATLVPITGNPINYGFNDGQANYSAILDGNIVGVTYNAAVNDVPEPGTIGMLGLGLVGLGGMIRRRQRLTRA